MTIKRIITGGAKNFARGGAVSIATVMVMTVTLAIFALLIFLSAILTYTLSSIQDKVDVNVYFTTNATEEEIVTVKENVEQLPEVAVVTYTSREDALTAFRERHAEDQLTIQALEELSENPLGAVLSIKAKNPEQYEGIVAFLSDDMAVSSTRTSADIIDEINYFQNKTVIDRLTATMQATQQTGLIMMIVFALASAIIVFATIRLAIYTSREEIGVMRLVGASNMYIRGPFIVAGIISGILSAIIVLVLFYPIAWYAGRELNDWLGGFNVLGYYISHFPLFFLVLIGSGIVLSGIGSFLSVRKYLKV